MLLGTVLTFCAQSKLVDITIVGRAATRKDKTTYPCTHRRSIWGRAGHNNSVFQAAGKYNRFPLEEWHVIGQGRSIQRGGLPNLDRLDFVPGVCRLLAAYEIPYAQQQSTGAAGIDRCPRVCTRAPQFNCMVDNLIAERYPSLFCTLTPATRLPFPRSEDPRAHPAHSFHLVYIATDL